MANNVKIYTDYSNAPAIIKEFLYYNQTIKDVHKRHTSSGDLILFWFGWVVLTGFLVFGFVYIDNHWLEDRW